MSWGMGTPTTLEARRNHRGQEGLGEFCGSRGEGNGAIVRLPHKTKYRILISGFTRNEIRVIPRTPIVVGPDSKIPVFQNITVPVSDFWGSPPFLVEHLGTHFKIII